MDLLKPFDCLEHLLTALYILNQHSSYQVNILNNLVILATGAKTTSNQIRALTLYFTHIEIIKQYEYT